MMMIYFHSLQIVMNVSRDDYIESIEKKFLFLILELKKKKKKKQNKVSFTQKKVRYTEFIIINYGQMNNSATFMI